MSQSSAASHTRLWSPSLASLPSHVCDWGLRSRTCPRVVPIVHMTHNHLWIFGYSAPTVGCLIYPYLSYYRWTNYRYYCMSRWQAFDNERLFKVEIFLGQKYFRKAFTWSSHLRAPSNLIHDSLAHTEFLQWLFHQGHLMEKLYPLDNRFY